MANIEKGWHCTYSFKYHIVWVTKNRCKKFFGQVEKDTKGTLKQIAESYYWEIEEMEMMPAHIHLYIATEPTDRPSDVVKLHKGGCHYAKLCSVLHMEGCSNLFSLTRS